MVAQSGLGAPRRPFDASASNGSRFAAVVRQNHSVLAEAAAKDSGADDSKLQSMVHTPFQAALTQSKSARRQQGTARRLSVLRACPTWSGHGFPSSPDSATEHHAAPCDSMWNTHDDLLSVLLIDLCGLAVY